MLTEAIIKQRLNSADELETFQRWPGETVERLPLRLGDTTITREILPDGSRGNIEITTQETSLGSHIVLYRDYVMTEGGITTKAHSSYEIAKPITPINRIKLLAKVALSKVDHWDMNSDFNYEE